MHPPPPPSSLNPGPLGGGASTEHRGGEPGGGGAHERGQQHVREARGRRGRATPRRLRRALLATLALALAAAATAQALHLQIGDLVVEAEGGFAPKALPKHHDAPITIHGGGKISHRHPAPCRRS